MDELTQEAKDIIAKMLKELSTNKYLYESYVLGCYYTCINRYKYKKPKENKDVIISKVLKILKELEC